MTKRHFKRLAEYLADTRGYCEPFTAEQIEHLANFCHESSSGLGFKRDTFIEYIKKLRKDTTR